MSKSAVARKLGISRETVRKYANKPDGYIPVMDRSPQKTTVDPYLPHIAKMLKAAKDEDAHIPTTVIYEEIQTLVFCPVHGFLSSIVTKGKPLTNNTISIS